MEQAGEPAALRTTARRQAGWPRSACQQGGHAASSKGAAVRERAAADWRLAGAGLEVGSRRGASAEASIS